MELFVPGRLCLLGEHSDWAAGYRLTHPELERGYCLTYGIEQGLAATVAPSTDLVLESTLDDSRSLGPERSPMRVEALDAGAREGGFFSYALGAAAEVLERFRVGGAHIRIEVRGLPIARGLSSSAAVCVLVVRALGRLHGLGLGLEDEMDLAWRGERRAGSACGRMDQICALGQRPALLTFDGPELQVEPLVAGGRLDLLIVDLKARKDTRRILDDLHRCFPDVPTPRARAVREALGQSNAALVKTGRDLLAKGDARGLGELMIEAQRRFDESVAPACPELDAPRLHRVLSHPALRELGWGAQGVGSQGDGTAQVVTRGPEESRRLAARLAADLGVVCLPTTLLPRA